MPQGYQALRVWQSAMDLACAVYRFAKRLPVAAAREFTFETKGSQERAGAQRSGAPTEAREIP